MCRRSLLLWVLIAAVATSLAACGDVGTKQKEPWKSGSRLRAHLLDSGDGAQQFINWRDTELQFDCSFRIAADGAIRCLPTYYSSRTYSDAACTAPVIALSACDIGVPPFVLEEPTTQSCGADGPMYTVLPVGRAVKTPEIFYKDVSGTCYSNGPPVDPSRVYELKPAADPTMFVGATENEEDRGDELGVRIFEGDDGSHQITGVYDQQRAVPCSNVTIGSVMACVPQVGAYHDPGVGAYSDPTCMTQVAYSYAPASCPAPTLGLDFTPPTDMCGAYEVTLFTVGAEITAPYSDSAGMCMPIPPSPDQRFWAMGAEVPVADYPVLTRTADGDGALATYGYHEAGGDLLYPDPYSPFRDTARGADCYPRDLGGGAFLCSPPYVLSVEAASGFYADMACTQQVAYAYIDPCNTAGPPVAIFDTLSGMCDQKVTAATAVGAEFNGLVYIKNPGDTGCYPYMPSPEEHYYMRGAAIALDTFPHLMDVVE